MLLVKMIITLRIKLNILLKLIYTLIINLYVSLYAVNYIISVFFCIKKNFNSSFFNLLKKKKIFMKHIKTFLKNFDEKILKGGEPLYKERSHTFKG